MSYAGGSARESIVTERVHVYICVCLFVCKRDWADVIHGSQCMEDQQHVHAPVRVCICMYVHVHARVVVCDCMYVHVHARVVVEVI
jgi:hypothetical protein